MLKLNYRIIAWRIYYQNNTFVNLYPIRMHDRMKLPFRAATSAMPWLSSFFWSVLFPFRLMWSCIKFSCFWVWKIWLLLSGIKLRWRSISGNTLFLNPWVNGWFRSTRNQLIQEDYLQKRAGGRQIGFIGQKRGDFYCWFFYNPNV